jgi:hypothetical protein
MLEKVPLTGNHIYMSPQEIDDWYGRLSAEWETYLKEYDVKMPDRKAYSALWLIFLRKHLGRLVHKDTIADFVISVRPRAGRDQQVRHLAARGWYVLNKGEKLPQDDDVVPSGYHVLVSVEQPKPDFLWKALKRAGRIAARNFEQLKAVYAWRCASCGSQEGKPHLLMQNRRTKLQQGHMDPRKKLTLENSIPQCQVCNRVYKDDYVFDEKGRVIAVAGIGPVSRAAEEVQAKIREWLCQ